MKLYYFKLPGGVRNFGDNLNPWLWDQLIPGTLDSNEKVAFVAIGSLLNDGLPERTRHAEQRVIFGTGVGYGKGALQLDDSYKVYCVRGPLSARALGLPEDVGITDGAALIRKVFKSTAAKKYPFAYMPHYELAGEGWAKTCERLGYGYIDPGWPVEDVLAALGQTEVLLAEAMHGAIIADALRIPWIPIVTNSSILPFKWQDWCASIEVEYQPNSIERLYNPRENKDMLSPVRAVRDRFRQQKAGKALKQIATSQSPFLSQQSRIEMLTDRLEEKLHQFKQDVKRGSFE